MCTINIFPNILTLITSILFFICCQIYISRSITYSFNCIPFGFLIFDIKLYFWFKIIKKWFLRCTCIFKSLIFLLPHLRNIFWFTFTVNFAKLFGLTNLLFGHETRLFNIHSIISKILK